MRVEEHHKQGHFVKQHHDGQHDIGGMIPGNRIWNWSIGAGRVWVLRVIRCLRNQGDQGGRGQAGQSSIHICLSIPPGVCCSLVAFVMQTRSLMFWPKCVNVVNGGGSAATLGGVGGLLVIACLTGAKPISPEDGPQCHSGPSHSPRSPHLPPPLSLHYLTLFLHLILRQQGGLRPGATGEKAKSNLTGKRDKVTGVGGVRWSSQCRGLNAPPTSWSANMLQRRETRTIKDLFVCRSAGRRSNTCHFCTECLSECLH